MLNKSIRILWYVEDVQDVRPDLNDEQSYEVLLFAKAHHDANIGINWDVLECTAEFLYPLSERGL
jgi:hypothetical protein